MLTVLSNFPSFGAVNSGMPVMGPLKVHSVYGVEGASSGWKTGVHKPPPMGRFSFLADSIKKRFFMYATLSGIFAARSLAWLQSSSRLYNSQTSFSGFHLSMPAGLPGTHGVRGPNVSANQPSW